MAGFTSEEYTDMLVVYGMADCNGREARRIYQERYPNRRVPNHQTFGSIYRRLRETGNLNFREPARFQPNLAAEERILAEFEEDPTRSVRTVARTLGLSVWKVWSVLRENGRHPFHYTPVQGMGRNSSRIASRRIASNSREPTSYAGLLSDDEDDADWAGGSGQSDRRKRRIKSNNNRKPNKMHKQPNNGASTSDANDGGATYETMTANEKKNLLQQICGVVSEHTKKLCTRSTRCPQHTEEQRRALRNSVLEPSTPESQTMGLTAEEAGSPPDSSPSSSCSSSSRKRDRHRAPPKTKNKRERNTSPNARE